MSWSIAPWRSPASRLATTPWAYRATFQIESVSLSRNTIIAITMILTLGSVLLGYRIARSITVPLTGLVDTAEAVTAGDLERRTAIQLRAMNWAGWGRRSTR